MGFFGEEISEQKVELEVPEHYTLNLLQACIAPTEATEHVTHLYVRTINEDIGFALCSLGGSKSQPVRFCSLRHEFGPEDSPLLLYSSGGKIHLTGAWKWTADAGMDDDDGDDESCDDQEEEHMCTHEGECGHGLADDSDDQEDEAPADSKKEEKVVVKSSKRKHDEAIVDEGGGTDEEVPVKKTTRNKRGGKTEEAAVVPANQLVVVSKPPMVETQVKGWKIKPQNDEGLPVPVPKQKTMKTGVLITDYVIGKGAEPKLGSAVKITYEGMFPNGKVFDKNASRKKPLKFRVGSGQVIRGLDLGMDKMRVGGSREIVIPPALGYGKDGIADIPGNQVLVFRITLIGIEKKSLSRR